MNFFISENIRRFWSGAFNHPPVKLILGLGNPGERYAGTRHNLGALAVQQLARDLGLELTHTSHQAFWGKGRQAGEECILALPQTFMNLSGRAAQSLIHYFKIPLDRIIIVSDDLALPLGRLRLRGEGSAGGHNGLKSVIECLGTSTFARLRLGLGSAPPGRDTAEYVLAGFAPAERAAVADCTAQAAKVLAIWISEGLEAAMRAANA
jgi:peptidyl-tRNA hydrolase, PTH1 family